MIFNWIVVMVMIITGLSLVGVVIAFIIDSDVLFKSSFILLLMVLFFGWLVGFNTCYIKTLTEPSYYTNKFITKDNIIIEYPDSRIESLTNMKYLQDSIYVEKVTRINVYNDTTISYRIKE